MTQQSLLTNTAQGEIATRLLARREDPETSKAAARRVVERHQPKGSLALFLRLLMVRSLTTREAGVLADPGNALYWHWEFAKRTHAWHVAGHIELRGEVKAGGRVWRAH